MSSIELTSKIIQFEEDTRLETQNSPKALKPPPIKKTFQKIAIKLHNFTLAMFYFYAWFLYYPTFWSQLLFILIISVMTLNFLYFRGYSRLYNLSLICCTIALIVDIIDIIFMKRQSFISMFLISLTFLIVKSTQQIILQCVKVFKVVKNLLSMMFFMFIVCSYVATDYFMDDESAQKYFHHFGRSFFTLIQVQTLDGWSLIGREINKKHVLSIPFGPILLTFFIFLVTFFYMNIMIGIIIDTIQPVNKIISEKLDDFQATQERILMEILRPSVLDNILLGDQYEWIIYILSFGSISFDILHDFQSEDETIDIIVNYANDIIFTFHLIVILFKEGKIYAIQRGNKILMMLHFLAGPIALLGTFFINDSIGSILNLLKLATTPSIRGIIIGSQFLIILKGTLKIFPLLSPSFIELIGLFMIFGALFSMKYSNLCGPMQQCYFKQFWPSVYSMVQVMTLDDWCNGIINTFRNNDIILPLILMPIVIYITNFIILNTLIAISCEYFTEIKDYNIDKERLNSKKKKFIDVGQLNEYLQKSNKKLFSSVFPKVSIDDHVMLLTEQEQKFLAIVKSQSHLQNMKLIIRNKKFSVQIFLTQKDSRIEAI